MLHAHPLSPPIIHHHSLIHKVTSIHSIESAITLTLIDANLNFLLAFFLFFYCLSISSLIINHLTPFLFRLSFSMLNFASRHPFCAYLPGLPTWSTLFIPAKTRSSLAHHHHHPLSSANFIFACGFSIPLPADIITPRLGKQARATNHYDESPKKHESSPPQTAAQQQKVMGHPTEPAGVVPGHNGQPAPVPDAYSVQPGDNQNRVAQADGVAAHHAEGNQNLASASPKSRKTDDVAKIVAEENESRSKFTKYPGLERWRLIEKMGDGAFSNVYRARDLTGNAGEVAIKVVRKFEMNNMQVSDSGPGRRPKRVFLFWISVFHVVLFLRSIISIFYAFLPTLESCHRATSMCIRTSRKFRRQQRCENFQSPFLEFSIFLHYVFLDLTLPLLAISPILCRLSTTNAAG